MVKIADKPTIPNEASQGRSALLAKYVADAESRHIPPRVFQAAKNALIDHVGVAIGGLQEPAAKGARKLAIDWQAPGRARILGGPKVRAGLAAFANGTAAHVLDFDDTHIGGSGHISAPVWSTALAVASDHGRDEMAALKGFIAGYEIMARLGGGGVHGVGKALQERGLHPTSINGVVGAAAAASSIMGHDETTTANALGLAATSAGGLVVSFGTDGKPYHAGRAAWNGILASELAEHGLQASSEAFEIDRGLLSAFVQDGNVSVPALSFEDWELDQNGYKLYPCCRAAHASIQAAHGLSSRIENRRIARVRAEVHWSAQFTAGISNPRTPLEAKFSVSYCVAAALLGHNLTLRDFEARVLGDPAVRALTNLVKIDPVREKPQKEALVEVWFEDGKHLSGATNCFVGHPDNPMSRDQFVMKFMSLVEPAMGTKRAEALFETLANFDRPGSLQEYITLCGSN